MPHFWDFGRHHSPKHHRNLQDGLFQIASQTCSLLVQVNNTNNISYGNNSSNIHLNNLSGMSVPSPSSSSSGSSTRMGAPSRTPAAATGRSQREGDREQLLVLIPPTHPGVVQQRSNSGKYRPGVLGKPRLSTVLETPTIHAEDETDIWSHGYTAQADVEGTPTRWGTKSKWCRPSCIPISIICILIFLVVLLPLLDHAAERALLELNYRGDNCNNTCQLSLTESIPEGLIFPNDSTSYPSTFDTWLDIINSAQESIDIASYYWTIRNSEVYPDPSSAKGELIFQNLLRAGLDRGIKIRIVQNLPSQDYPDVDTELLVKRKAAEVRTLNFAKLLGAGILHTKFWIVDRRHAYVGSANMDWRSLTQVKEMGIAIKECSCLAEDLSKIFEVYWALGVDNAKIPSIWPASLSTKFNLDSPMDLIYQNETYQTYFSSSPPPFNPAGRTNDVDALVDVIKHAEKFVHIAVMDYVPAMIYTPKLKFWPVIDDALRTVAIEHKIKVKLLISKWNHTKASQEYFLKSLAAINKVYPGVSVQVRWFIVPANKDQQKIPFARVNHNKYMVTDNTAYIGTSNWSGDYFTDTAGVSFVFRDPVYDRNSSHVTIRSQLEGVFQRDWNSPYSEPVEI